MGICARHQNETQPYMRQSYRHALQLQADV
jgi:hypothetical protein